jgi:peptidoglycan/xylan/chitin deacetylase (PgdA/CDA1 family)
MRILSLLWHSVESDSIHNEYNYGLNPTKSLFNEQIKFIVDKYTPISIFDFANISEDNNIIKTFYKPPVLLGFDDGFKNVINFALPVLNNFEIPAILYVIGKSILNKDFVPWYLEIEHMARKTKKKTIRFDKILYDPKNKNEKISLINYLTARYKELRSENKRRTFLINLSKIFEVERPLQSHLDEDLHLVTKEDLKDLGTDSLLTISSHSMTHNPLANLTRQEQAFELEQSNLILSKNCLSYYPVIAYPNGSFNDDTINIAKKFYKFGFAVFFGSSYNNLFKYPRISIHSYNVKRLEYVLSFLRLNVLLPLKKLSYYTGLQKIGK